MKLRESKATSASTADRVVHAVVDHIRRHKLTAGAALPSEIQTSAQLDISRGIVREAYRSLSSAGILHIVNGSSPRVGRITNRALTQVLQHAVSTQQATAAQVLELRGPLEECAAELAAGKRTPEDVAELRQAVAAMRAAKGRNDRYVKADIQFHEIIGRATGNPLFWLIGSALRESMDVSIRVSLAGRASQAEVDAVIDTHAAIVDAIEKGDAAAALELMRRHSEEARTSVQRQLTMPQADDAGPATVRKRSRRVPGSTA
jgi:DNA-binding FadR family transcriptional regulator